MNKIKIYLLLVILNLSDNVFAKYEKKCDKCLVRIYQACPEFKESMDHLAGGRFGQEAGILLGILAGRPGEIAKCPSLLCLQDCLSIFETCIVRVKLQNLEAAGFNSSDQGRQLALVMKIDPAQEKQRDQAIRQQCLREFRHTFLKLKSK